MILSINPNDTVLDLKSRFSDEFAGLKIEFFASHHESGEGSPKKEKLNGQITIREINSELIPLKIIIEPHMTVSELEKMFFQEAKLNVQIFRKMGIVWLETVQTDNYTLKKQMELSAESRS